MYSRHISLLHRMINFLNNLSVNKISNVSSSKKNININIWINNYPYLMIRDAIKAKRLKLKIQLIQLSKFVFKFEELR